MRVLFISILNLILFTGKVFSQYQNSDEEGLNYSSSLKKLNKKARYGAYSIQKEVDFGTGKGIQGIPIVTAEEKGVVEMASIQDKSFVGYMLEYNQFVKVMDYDFEIFYKDKFRSQRYPPARVSLTDDEIFLDDSYGMVYGFEASEAGQRSRFKYKYQYTDAKYFTRVFFHQGIPVLKNSISLKVPAWLELDIAEKNFKGFKIKKEVKKEKNYTVYTYTAENLVGYKQEPSSLARPYFLPHLILTVRGYTVDQKKYNGFRSLDDMYSWYNFLYKKAENKPEVLKDQVQQLTAGKKTDEEKIKSIYYWVQDNIRYIAFEEGYSGFIPHTVQDVFKNKYGDCKGMANLVTEMLKLAGYEAHFAWVGTRDIPYDRREVQSMCVDNHAISVLYYKGKPYFIDGTEKYASFGTNAYRIQGKSVLVEFGDQYKVEDVPAASMSDNQMSTKVRLKLQGDKIVGHVTMTYDGASRNLFHYYYNSIPVNRRKEFMNEVVKLSNRNTEVANVKTSDFKNRDIPIVIEGDVVLSNQITKVNDQYYVGIDFFPGSITRFIPDEERINPININDVFLTADEVVLELPKGAMVKSLPAAFNASYLGNEMEGSYTVNGNTVTLKKVMKLNSPVIHNADFAGWKSFVNQIKSFNRNNITVQIP
ncbi:transglutaminase-like domain-containing protein [Flavihumibacter rivuli]|uniref:transglutaminase-like domain-containing protein n=1 Tax=Flavihumibacter rivuli TaxID=2838156 RepID=UPI001BDE6101|nr:transglutaminase-like domain-containing protein [Flavihumibacter rivuli]ULQ56702.1 transglutaminase-like domain-containing protein [Flavihumibacter rivuli]